MVDLISHKLKAPGYFKVRNLKIVGVLNGRATRFISEFANARDGSSQLYFREQIRRVKRLLQYLRQDFFWGKSFQNVTAFRGTLPLPNCHTEDEVFCHKLI